MAIAPAISAQQIRDFQPSVADASEHPLRRQFPAALLSKEARAAAREDALLDLDTIPDAMPWEAIRPLLALEQCLWSMAVATYKTTRPFWAFLKSKLEKGEAHMLADYPEADAAIRAALDVPLVVKRVTGGRLKKAPARHEQAAA